MNLRKRDGSRERVNRNDSAAIGDAELDKAIVAMCQPSMPSPPPQSPPKRFEGHSRSYPGVPLDEEGGDLLSRIAVQYHRRARA